MIGKVIADPHSYLFNVTSGAAAAPTGRFIVTSAFFTSVLPISGHSSVWMHTRYQIQTYWHGAAGSIGNSERLRQLGDLKRVTIYTDGACLGNPGPGGYGVVLRFGAHVRELSAGYRRTTNNRMELLAAVMALSVLKESCCVSIYSDATYLVNMMNGGYSRRWKARGWKRSKTEKALNADLWAKLLNLCDIHEVTFIWVKGHAGDPGNERCDNLAMKAARQPDLLIDDGYEVALPTTTCKHAVQLSLDLLVP